jgi:hypothetical protein
MDRGVGEVHRRLRAMRLQVPKKAVVRVKTMS